MPATMNAVRIHDFGGPEVLQYEQAPRPVPAAGELLIRVHAAGINPVDWKTRERGAATRRDQLPLILGWDVSGIVEEAGDGVADFSAGDAVYGLVRFPAPGSAYAEYLTAPADQLAPRPGSLDHVEAAAMPLVALTAWQALFDAAGLAAGQTLLVHAAAGGVGHIAVQLAKWKGARVIGTASARNEDFLREIGVDQFIDYTTTRFEDVVSDIDVVLDTMAEDTRERSWGVLKRGGVLVSILGDPSPESAAERGVRAARTLVQPNATQLRELTTLFDSGEVKPAIDSVFPLQEVRAAHERIQTGHVRGKVVLRVVE